MIKVCKRLCLLTLMALWLIGQGLPVWSQTPSSENQITLVADDLSFDAETQVLTATGNVQIFSGDRILRTQELIYDQANGTLSVPGPLEIIAGGELTTVADSAELSQEMTEGLITGAEMLIGGQLQVAGQELHHTQNRFRTFEKAVASTCQICADRRIPLWQIRARRVIHDEQERRVYYEHARLEVVGVPILWLPRLRTPDPSVNRATGFLVPAYSVSDKLGTGVSIPYYIVTGDHSDVTLTPEIYSDGSVLLTTDYRQRFRTGQIRVLGTLVFNDQQVMRSFRSNLTVTGSFRVFEDFTLSFNVNLASDKTVRSDYNVLNPGRGRLTNRIALSRTKEDRYFELSATAIQSLRSNEVDQQIPVSLPEYYNRRIWDNSVLGGKLGITAQGVALLREQDNRFIRGGISFDWQKQWRSRFGLVTNVTAKLDTSLYSVENYTGFANQTFTNAIPTMAVDLRLPLARRGDRVQHLLEPRLQVIWSPDDARTNPNEDSQTIEFEDTNLFTLNRYPGFDRTERGLRANVGLSYTMIARSGWELGGTVGRIFRSDNLGEFRTGSGLEGSSSAYATSVSLAFKDRLNLVNRLVFDDDFDVRRIESEAYVRVDKLSLSMKYAWLDAGVLSDANPVQSEASLSAVYRLNTYWSLTSVYRQNLETDVVTSASLGATFQNECIKVQLSMAATNINSTTTTENRTYGIRVELAGLGSKAQRTRYKRLCRG